MQWPRWWYLRQHHRASQIGWRVASIAQRKLFPLLPHSWYTNVDEASIVRRENVGFEAIVSRQLRLREEGGNETASGLLAGDFEFLNVRRRLPSPIDWQVTSVEPVSHLWRFHLHYQEFLLDLLQASRNPEDTTPSEHLWAVVSDWIENNSLDRPGALSDAWHPFCLSQRIAVWLMVWQAIDPPEDLRSRFVASLESQIRYLERHLEWDLRGNHLLENLRTLTMAGAFFEGPTAERRLDVAERWIREQLAEQILASGEHFERTPMYHVQMLSAVLDVRDAVHAIRPELAVTCQNVAQRMSTFLSSLLHPDGRIPLLADSAFGETPNVEVLLADVKNDVDGRPRDDGDSEQTISEYWTWRDGGDFVLVDAGPVGSDELPAHAHCDLLTIEASIDDQRVFVDSGVHDYGDGEMRQYCRSTAAHNVLQVDGVEQCDMWSRFRLGYRGHPSRLEHGQTGPFSWCRATHNAYRRIGVPVVGRWLACHTGRPWICVDWADGTGSHELTTRLHLAPDVAVTLESPQMACLHVGERTLQVQSLTTAEFSIEKGWHCPDFSVRRQTCVLKLTSTCQLPACLGWIVQDIESRGGVSIQTDPDGSCTVQWRDGREKITWNVTAARVESDLLSNERAEQRKKQ